MPHGANHTASAAGVLGRTSLSKKKCPRSASFRALYVFSQAAGSDLSFGNYNNFGGSLVDSDVGGGQASAIQSARSYLNKLFSKGKVQQRAPRGNGLSWTQSSHSQNPGWGLPSCCRALATSRI